MYELKIESIEVKGNQKTKITKMSPYQHIFNKVAPDDEFKK